MEYYQSTRPPVDDSGLSGGVSFQFNGQIATQGFNGAVALPNDGTSASNNNKGNGGGGGPTQTYTLQICIDGNPYNLKVYVDGDPTPV